MLATIQYALIKLIESCDETVDSSIIKSIAIRAKTIIDRINIIVNTPVSGVTIEDFEKELETKRHIILLSDEEYNDYQKIMKLKSLLKDSEII